MKLDPNAPAFPVPGIPPVSTGDPRDGMGYGTDPQPGITVRAYIATRAMQSYIGHLAATGQTVSKCHAEIADESCRIADALIAALNGTPAAPVPASPPALPPGIPEPPEGVAYYGMGPLKVAAKNNDRFDVFSFDPRLQGDLWESYNTGECEPPYLHYALRRGTPIARANGIPD